MQLQPGIYLSSPTLVIDNSLERLWLLQMSSDHIKAANAFTSGNKNKAPFIAKFPIYAASFNSRESLLILAGGGGPSKSGLQNGCLLLHLHPKDATLSLVGELATGEEAIMACDSFSNYIALGVNDRCWLTELSVNNTPTSTSAKLNLIRSVQADFSPTDDGYLRFVRFNNHNSLFVGGSEGKAREWSLPELRLLQISEPEDNNNTDNLDELVDGDVFLVENTQKPLTVMATKNKLHLHGINATSQVSSITSPLPNYTFRHVRILSVAKKILIAAVLNPERKGNKPSAKPAICFFDVANGKLLQKPTFLPFARNVTAIALSPIRMAFGFADGSLVVYARKGCNDLINFSAMYLKIKEAHPFPVTSIIDTGAPNISISVSADGVVLVHKLPPLPIASNSLSSFTAFLLIVFLLVVLPLALAVLANQERLLTQLQESLASWWNRRDELAEFDAFYDAIMNNFNNNNNNMGAEEIF